MRVEHRLSKLEQVIATIHEPRLCMIFGDDADAEAAVAQFRDANNWPTMLRIRYRWYAYVGGQHPRSPLERLSPSQASRLPRYNKVSVD